MQAGIEEGEASGRDASLCLNPANWTHRREIAMLDEDPIGRNEALV